MDTYSEWNKCQWDKETTTSAAEFGHLECMEYLHKNGCIWHGCPWDKHVTLFAATNGHLECLTYLHKNGCLWNEKATSANGHLECLKYLHKNGCPWHEYATGVAVEKGQLFMKLRLCIGV